MRSFWLGRVFISRVVPITLFVFFTYNAFGYSFADWAMFMARSVGEVGAVYGLILAIAVIIMGAIWLYILQKAWRGAGSGVIKALILPLIAGLILAIPVTLNVVELQSVAFITMAEFALGIVLGLMFSMTIMDRYLSGTVTTVTEVQADETHDGHHDGHTDN